MGVPPVIDGLFMFISCIIPSFEMDDDWGYPVMTKRKPPNCLLERHASIVIGHFIEVLLFQIHVIVHSSEKAAGSECRASVQLTSVGTAPQLEQMLRRGGRTKRDQKTHLTWQSFLV